MFQIQPLEILLHTRPQYVHTVEVLGVNEHTLVGILMFAERCATTIVVQVRNNYKCSAHILVCHAH